MVYDGAVYFYIGYDEQEIGIEGYLMKDWFVFLFINLEDWIDYGLVFVVSDFFWVFWDVWVVYIVEWDGKFYWYVLVEYCMVFGKVIGVVVLDSLIGLFLDVCGDVLIINDMIIVIDSYWDDIDFVVYIDDDGQVFIFWGNMVCYYVKFKDNMIELDGEIYEVEGLVNFMEVFYIYKKDDQYYLIYVVEWLERIVYVIVDSFIGIWKYQGIINDYVENSFMNYQIIIEYEGQFYFIYYNGSLFFGGDYWCLVCIDSLFYWDNGIIVFIV